MRLVRGAPAGTFDSAMLAGGWNLLCQASASPCLRVTHRERATQQLAREARTRRRTRLRKGACVGTQKTQDAASTMNVCHEKGAIRPSHFDLCAFSFFCGMDGHRRAPSGEFGRKHPTFGVNKRLDLPQEIRGPLEANLE